MMRFIEMTGKTLLRIVNVEETPVAELRKAGVADDSIVRINLQGDIELRRPHRWDCIGGLLGDFQQRVQHETGFDWT
jgi:hypothetical protein